MKTIIGYISISILVGIILTGCGTMKNVELERSDSKKGEQTKIPENSVKAPNHRNEETRKNTIETENGTFSVALPEGWDEIEPTELNDDADISLENDKKMMYATVLSESNEDFEDFDSFKEATDFHNWLEIENETEQELDSNGWKGTRYFVSAKVEGVRIFYVYDVAQSDAGHYVQKMAWTMNSKKNKNKEELETVLNSIQDITK